MMLNESLVDTPSSLRVVLDTTVLVSSGLTGLQAEYIFELLATKKLVGYTSITILDEVDRTMERKFAWNERQRSRLLDYFIQQLLTVSPAVITEPKLRDPGDLHVLGTAVAAEAHLLITTDRDLLSLKRFKGIAIIHLKTLRWTFSTARGDK